ncbi:MAG: hypothetical protein WGN25_19150 [Candidatus Electrothrix sp. GW3-4]|uniref:hypothetical protein n=1 Tax=Candidatus Electrothrix sp. GW3-4 TaxID=3126740 RepID=UPI0030D623E9
MKRSIPNDTLLDIFRLDDEIIDIETNERGTVYPVVRCYDDEQVHLHFWCIHCRKWHIHGRGGANYPYQEGRGGMAGHRVAHCIVANSPYKENGVVLHVVGKFNPSVRKGHRKGVPLICPRCHNGYYSAALNACECGYYNSRRQSSHPEMAKRYQDFIKGEE